MERLVAVRGDIGLDPLGVDLAAVGENDGELLGEERRTRVRLRKVLLDALQGLDDRRRVLGRDLHIERVEGIGLHERALAAQLKASDAAHLDRVLEAGGRNRLRKLLLHSLRVGRHASGRHAAPQHHLLARGQLVLLDLL